MDRAVVVAHNYYHHGRVAESRIAFSLHAECEGQCMNMEEFAGRVQELKGAMKMVAGKIVADVTLEAEGELDRACGRSRRRLSEATQRARVQAEVRRRHAVAGEVHRYR
jgi:uncharacterized protein YjbJ (UPF0337 family)